ncbi:MAG: hypothetical protein N2258_00675 [Brevinematales bacterium]|nr:hypothetical protein [Brevinematales bacterium]
MTVFIAIIAFGFAFYLFFVTNNKIKSLKENVLFEETKKEFEALITEFNRAAARNIELLEDKISELQELIKRADIKILKLEEISKSSTKPIIIEKIVEKNIPEETNIKPTKIEETKNKESTIKEDRNNETSTEKEVKIEEKQEKNDRREKLKMLILEGKTKDELIASGFMENEINLVSFLIKVEKEGKK